MTDPTKHPRSAFAVTLAAALATSASGCVGIASGITYPDVSDVDLDKYLLTPEGDPNPSVSLSHFKIAPSTCKDIDHGVVTTDLGPEDLGRFFATQNVKVEQQQARDNLYWFGFGAGDDAVKLRLAILKNPNAAAKDLHDSLVEHGPGWWGVRRGNLALLAPKAGLGEALRFAIKTKLVCWGVFTYAGADDVYVTVGGYSEF
ncbi:MAG: hypothetical protein U0414_23195 [Polyangiaceae bacterium]